MGRKLQKSPPALVVGSTASGSEPPATLGAAGSKLWRSVMTEYDIRDSGGLAILEQACASLDRAESCRVTIAEQGLMITTRSGPKDHPLIRHETASRALVGRLLARLNLDMEPINKSVGRPGGGSLAAWIPPQR
jgi:hypothetical protein